MDFEVDDIIVNLRDLKASFFDELVSMYVDRNGVECTFEQRMGVMIEVINTLKVLGQNVGD